MSDDGRAPPTTLKGRLADVYVPALVDGALEALARRLGNRATVDDPVYGRASSLASLDPLIAKLSAWLRQGHARYRHVYSTTGVDRDAAEGVLSLEGDGGARELPIVVVAERRRLREIELRVYYAGVAGASRKIRPPLVRASQEPVVLAGLVQQALAGVGRRAPEEALAAFEESARVVDPRGSSHEKRDGGLARWLGDLAGATVEVGGAADDGRTCCLEVTMARDGVERPAVLAFERGESGLIRELRAYWDDGSTVG